MKRLLALILVLGLASTANAILTEIQLGIDGSSVGPEYDVVTGNTISVEVYTGNTNAGLAYLGFEDNGLYTLSNPRTPYYDPPLVTYTYSYVSGGYHWFEITVSSTPEGTITPGIIFLVDLTAGGSTGTVDVILADETFVTKDTTVINIVPEPVTITLFALGGLAILRKRRG